MQRKLNGFQGVVVNLVFLKRHEMKLVLSLGAKSLWDYKYIQICSNKENMLLITSVREHQHFFSSVLSFQYQDGVEKANSLQ